MISSTAMTNQLQDANSGAETQSPSIHMVTVALPGGPSPFTIEYNLYATLCNVALSNAERIKSDLEREKSTSELLQSVGASTIATVSRASTPQVVPNVTAIPATTPQTTQAAGPSRQALLSYITAHHYVSSDAALIQENNPMDNEPADTASVTSSMHDVSATSELNERISQAARAEAAIRELQVNLANANHARAALVLQNDGLQKQRQDIQHALALQSINLDTALLTKAALEARLEISQKEVREARESQIFQANMWVQFQQSLATERAANHQSLATERAANHQLLSKYQSLTTLLLEDLQNAFKSVKR